MKRFGALFGLIAIIPDGAVIDVFDVVRRYAKEPVLGEQSPIEWGREEHVRELFGDRAELTFERRSFDPSPLGDVDVFKRYHPVVRMLYGQLADEPERIEALNRDLDAMAERWHDDAQRVLVILARKRAG